MSPEECAAYAEIASLCTVQGDIVECGVYNGDSLAAIAGVLPGRDVWAYDSFQGFPAGNPSYDDAVALGLEGAVVGSPAEVARALDGLYDHLHIREGWFEDTLEQGQPKPGSIAFLSVDCDLYESVLLVLRRLRPYVAKGGIITLDDWSCFIGCRRAYYRWAWETRQVPLLRTFGTGQAYWVNA
jgi:hypothetical protein